MNRRGFLQSMLAAGVAPAFVGSKVLMPVRSIVVPPKIPVSIVSSVQGHQYIANDLMKKWFEFVDDASLNQMSLMHALNARIERQCFETVKQYPYIRAVNG